MNDRFCFRLYGRFALFSDPVTRIGGEKCSYHVPTYEALKGVVKSVYWKPTIIWIVDRVRVMRAFRTQGRGMKLHPFEARDGAAGLAYFTYLRDVEYQVEVHFEWNMHRKEMEKDRNYCKHRDIFLRSLERGGRQDVFLGTRECQGYVEPCAFGEGAGDFDGTTELGFGLMFHGFDYPDETDYPDEAGKADEKMFRARFWHPVMRKGIIDFPRPDDPSLLRKDIRPMRPKVFSQEGGNFNPDSPAYPDAGKLCQGGRS